MRERFVELRAIINTARVDRGPFPVDEHASRDELSFEERQSKLASPLRDPFVHDVPRFFSARDASRHVCMKCAILIEQCPVGH